MSSIKSHRVLTIESINYIGLKKSLFHVIRVLQLFCCSWNKSQYLWHYSIFNWFICINLFFEQLITSSVMSYLSFVRLTLVCMKVCKFDDLNKSMFCDVLCSRSVENNKILQVNLVVQLSEPLRTLRYRRWEQGTAVEPTAQRPVVVTCGLHGMLSMPCWALPGLPDDLTSRDEWQPALELQHYIPIWTRKLKPNIRWKPKSNLWFYLLSIYYVTIIWRPCPTFASVWPPVPIVARL